MSGTFAHIFYTIAIYAIGRLHQQRRERRARVQTRLGDPINWKETAK